MLLRDRVRALLRGNTYDVPVALQPIFSAGQLPAAVVTTQQLPRGGADAAPVQAAQLIQVRATQRESDESAERVNTTLSDVGSTPTYSVHARVEPVPQDGRRRGQLFDSRA
jgi:hypothetical protein